MTPPVNASDKRFDITIAGETNLDLILYGLPAHLPVERELLGTGFQTTLGGSSSILAHNLAILGTRVGFVSQLGTDEMGDLAYQRLRHSGADLSQLTRSATHGTGVTLLLHHGDTRHILTYPGIMAQLSVQALDLNYLTSSRHFHLSSLFLQTGLHPGLPQLFDTLRAAGLTLSLDTNDDPADQWGGVLDPLLDRIDILLPNEDELLRIARKPTLDAALDALAPRIPLIVVKCGKRGAVVQQGSHRETIPPARIASFQPPTDTIGAGDSFNAGFLHAWLQGHPPAVCAAMGNRTGALSTQAPGGTEAFRNRQLLQIFTATDAVAIGETSVMD